MERGIITYDHMHNAHLKPGYNVQLAVEGECITGVDILSERSDQLTLEDISQCRILPITRIRPERRLYAVSQQTNYSKRIGGNMEIIIFGGFLGSGKTTVIKKILYGIVEKGQTAAIIENEIGEVGIDDVFFEGFGMSVTQIFGGCVCCQISGSLLEASAKIEDEIHPDWLIIEMTGLALMNNIRDAFNKYGRNSVTVHTVSVLDLSRWEISNSALHTLLENQLADTDVVVMNKTDISPVAEEIKKEVAKISQGALTLEISATQENQDLWVQLEKLINEPGREQG